MKMHFTILHLCLFSMTISEGSSGVITLYDYIEFNGSFIHIPINEKRQECVNMPENWQNRTSSITTGGLCVDLYSETNCKGEKHIRLYPGNYYHHVLPYWDFDDQLASAQVCDKVINEKNHEKEGDTLHIYDVNGNILLLNVPSCTNLPQLWRNRVTGTDTQNRCYNFYSEQNCTGRKLPLDKNYPSHNDFSKWNFANITNSIKPCPGEADDSPSASSILPSTSTDNSVPSDRRHHDKGLRKDTVILVSVSVVVMILLILLIGGIAVFFIYFRRRIDPSSLGAIQLEYLGKKYIENFIHGNPSAFQQVSFESSDAIYRAQNMPYDAETYEIPLEYLKIDWQSPLGSGEYGAVSKGKVTSPKFPEPIDVAVKTVKAGAEPGYVKALLDELKIMMYLNGSKENYTEHRHIVNLIGACTQNLSKLEPYIILELCTQGSLLNYLRKQRKRFVNLVSNGQIISSTDRRKSQSQSNAVYFQPKVNTIDLLKWSLGIADGMEFLSSKKVIHGDLAARNVLLDDQLNVKITDFGLSRQLYQYTQYVKTQQTPLPWRWLAIEALEDMSFSTQSDVWAYGITLHEIFTLGETPYPGIMFSSQFIANLKDGYRMPIPKYAPTVLYNLMMKCGEEFLEERPSFLEIREEIFNILEASAPQVYYTTMDE